MIFIVDDSAISREATTGMLQRAGHQTSAFNNAEEAIVALKQNPKVALVITELELPGMDGFRFLQMLRRNAPWAALPVIVLTDVESKSAVLKARELKANSYLLKSRFSVEAFLERVALCLAGTALQQNNIPPPASGGAEPPREKDMKLLTKADTKGRISQFLANKTIAGNIMELLELANGPAPSAATVSRIIAQDSALETRVLQIASSTAYQMAQQSGMSLELAVNTLGYRTVRTIAVSAGLFRLFPCSVKNDSGLMSFWLHNFAVAAAMDWMIPASNALPGCAHAIGLCHDMGEMALHQSCGAEYQAALEMAENSGESFANVKAATFGILPHELNPWVLEKLRLPEALAVPIGEFFEAVRNGWASATGPLAGALHLADNFANGLLLAHNPFAEVSPITAAECRSILGHATPVAFHAASLRTHVLAITGLLAQLTPGHESKWLDSMMPKHKIRVAYVRPACFSFFDPLEMALAAYAEVSIFPEIPSDVAVIQGCDMLVVATADTATSGCHVEDFERFSKIDQRGIPILCLSRSRAHAALARIPKLHILPLPVTLRALGRAMATLTQALHKVA